MMGVSGSSERSTMFRVLPRWPTMPSCLQYSSPRTVTVTGSLSSLDSEKSHIAFHRLYGTCPERSALVACVLLCIQCPKPSASQARAAAIGAL
eukprot:1178962-Prorocentrum_minimum.AAC.2